MPAFTVPDPPGDNAYSQPEVGWRWHQNSRVHMVDEGWKFHVSGSGAEAQTILDRVLPVVSAIGDVPHKFLPSTEDLAQQNQDAQQRGKFIAVYPSNIQDAFVILAEIDSALAAAGIAVANHPAVAGDLHVGNTLVYARYGSYQLGAIWNPGTGRFQADIPGAAPHRPGWIQDPWPLYQGPHTPIAAVMNLPGYVRHADQPGYRQALRHNWR